MSKVHVFLVCFALMPLLFGGQDPKSADSYQILQRVLSDIQKKGIRIEGVQKIKPQNGRLQKTKFDVTVDKTGLYYFKGHKRARFEVYTRGQKIVVHRLKGKRSKAEVKRLVKEVIAVLDIIRKASLKDLDLEFEPKEHKGSTVIKGTLQQELFDFQRKKVKVLAAEVKFNIKTDTNLISKIKFKLDKWREIRHGKMIGNTPFNITTYLLSFVNISEDINIETPEKVDKLLEGAIVDSKKDGDIKVSHSVNCPKGCEECKEAIERGLELIAKRQKRNGSWKGARYPEGTPFTTAMCGLALLAEGSSTLQGKYQEELKKAVRYLKGKIKPKGLVMSKKDRSFETWHVTFVSIFLSEIYRKDKLEDLKEPLARLEKQIERLQRDTGGWCHNPKKGPPNYSVDLVVLTNFVVVTLVTLKDLGIKVSPKTIKKAIKYYQKVYNKDGGFQYGLKHSWVHAPRSERGRTAGAIYALSLLAKEVPKASAKLKHMIKNATRYITRKVPQIPISPTHGGTKSSINYLSGALLFNNISDGWKDYILAFYPDILGCQDRKGNFNLEGKTRKALRFETALALIVLQLRLGHLQFAKLSKIALPE